LCLLENQLNATVLSPGTFTGAAHNWLLFTIAYGFNLATGSTVYHQESLNRVGATLTQSKVVLFGTAFVSVTFQANLLARIACQVSGVSNQYITGILFDFRGIEIKVESGDVAQGFLLRLGASFLTLLIAQRRR